MFEVTEVLARVLSRTTIAEDTMAFEIERPDGFTFEAGQFVSLQLPGLEPIGGDDDAERALSIASAPHDEHLLVAVRMRGSAFKQHLAQCAVGGEGASVLISPAMGDVVLSYEQDKPVVLLAGGIGITPFYSIVRDWQQRARQGQCVPPLTLVYGNRNRRSAVWAAEFDAIADAHADFNVVHVLADDAQAVAAGTPRSSTLHGVIDEALIRAQVADVQGSIYYVVGPTAMVAAMQDLLDACGVPPEQVIVEFFAGY